MNNIEEKEIAFAISKVTEELYQIFNADKEYYLENSPSGFKVNPGYGYGKFYLDLVEGSYYMSLQSLVNFILYEKGLYKKILSKEAYSKVASFIKENPEAEPDIYEDFEEEQGNIDGIIWISCAFMGCCFEKNGLDAKPFKDPYMDEEYMNSKIANSCFVYYDKILNFYHFESDLEKYLKSNNLSKEELKHIVTLSNSVFEIDKLINLSRIIYKIDKNIAKQIINVALKKVTKKSEYTMLSSFVSYEEYFNDPIWAKEIKKLKETL